MSSHQDRLHAAREALYELICAAEKVSDTGIPLWLRVWLANIRVQLSLDWKL